MQMEKMASWADDVEEEVAAGTHDPAGPPPVIHEDFPSLAQAAKVPAKPPPKKAKGKKMSLADIMAAPEPAPTRPAFGASRRDAPMSEREILMSLPTASRGKVEGEVDERGMGGAFNQYGGDRERGGGFARRDDRRGRGDGDDERDFPPASRADEVQDWGANRQFQPSGAPPGFARRGDRDAGPAAGFRDREPRPYSAADDVNDWGTTKKFEPSHDDRGRGGGYREGPPRDGPARRPGPGFDDRPMNRADQEDQWSRGREFQQAGPPGPRGTSGSRNFGFEDRAPRTSNLDAEDRWGKRQADLEATAAPGPATSTTERPRLKLQPRTLPVEAPVASTPAPVEDAAPTPAASAPAPKRSSNPFGAARPREEVLKEKGIDPKQQDELLLHPPPAAKVEPSTAIAPAPEELELATATQAPAFVSVEGPAELESKARIASLENDLQALKDEGDADEEDISEIATAIEHETAKLAQLKLEREQAEEKARQALANGELDSGSWVPATTKHHKAAPAAAAPTAPAAPHTPGTANGAGEKRGWGPAAGERKSPAGPGAAGRSGGRGPHHEGALARGSPEGQRPAGPRVVAAGAANVERKW